jgi:hypothetical protein
VAGDRSASAFGLAPLRAAGRAALGLPRLVRAAVCLAWMAGIYGLSSRDFQAPSGPEGFWRVAANLVHAPLYGGLCLLFGAWLAPSAAPARVEVRARARTFAAALGATILYAISDELHQGLVPGRHPAVLDVVTDATAAASVLWLAAYAARADARDAGLRARVAAAALLCLAAAALASFGGV